MISSTQKSLPRKSLKDLGISAQKVIDFLTYLKAHSIETHSLMLLRHGHVAAEGWWEPYRPELPHMLFSLSKSFTSTAIGMAVHEGYLSVDDAVISFFPDDQPEEVPDNLAAMKVRHLLTMGTGQAADPMEAMHRQEDGNWVRGFLEMPVEHEPGTFFVYNTGATYMLSAILQKVTGQTLLEFLQPRLFEPLGIEHPAWESDPRGINTGGYGLRVTTEDIAKFGQLYLQKGVWDGKRLLEESWIETATTKQISNGDGGDSDWTQGYGYQFWRCRHGAYRGDGAFGQFCIVLEQYDAVIALTSGTNDLQGVLDGVWQHLLGAFEGTADLFEETSDSEEASDQQGGFGQEGAAALEESAELQRCLQELRLAPPQLQAGSELEEAVEGRIYSLADNGLGIEHTRVQFDDETAVLSIQHALGEEKLEFGRGTWRHGQLTLLEREQVAGSFTWQTPEQLILTLRGIETPFCYTVEVQFQQEEIELRSRVNVSFGDTEGEVLRGRIKA
ncbi:serine hydrolase domain-containing protein [Paenibacillus pinistramenti]|uniref:serine hydrolase domain-containing protein n=1 Tax=Paenibacillus pinistramenti TaxID=1768003 RepID=UPI001109EF88|nr:serine hydrolase [Paenibacillus pinistramenti]